MNRLFPFPAELGHMLHKDGTKSTKLDYSYGDNIDLDENALREDWGLGGKDFAGIDWNCNGHIDDTSFHLKIWHPDYDMAVVCDERTFHDYNDWGSLTFKVYGYMNNTLREVQDEETPEEFTEYFPKFE